MSLSQREAAIRHDRMMDAIRNNLMGPTGKLGLIARHLGQPIIYQGSGLGDMRTMDEFLGEAYDVYETPDPNKLPTFDERDTFIEVEGYLFDGLSRGMHLEIKYTAETHKLTVHYKGYLVYMESSGDLYAYAPFKEWEDMVDRLVVPAQKNADAHKEMEDARIAAEAEARKEGFLHRLRMRWGF